MSVVIETTLGDITVDLFLEQRPITCLNFLKLCKMKYYNFNLFHSIRSGFIAQTGDPSGEGSGGESIWGLLNGPEKRFFSGEKMPKIRHTDAGLLSMVCTGEMMVGSQFFFTLGPDLDSLDGVHCVIGEVTEGHEILRKLNDVICDETHRPYQDVRITHTVVLEDPFSDPPGLRAPSRSPSPSAERLKGGRIAPDEELDEAQGKTASEIQEMIEEKEAKARATILEIVGDLPDADIAPPENVLFVCKLNPVTTDEDLEIIFSRFGKIVSCEVIRDKKTGDSLQYAFIEFDDKKSCEDAYFKMDNVLIDDRRIHVDFSQSVSKMRWLGKGRGVQHFNDDGTKVSDIKRDRSKRSRSKEHHNQKYSTRDNHADGKRNHDRTDRNVTNKRSHTERSRSRSKNKDQANSRQKQSSHKNDEYMKRDKRRERSSSQSKSVSYKTDKSNSNDKKDKSKDRYEDQRSKYDEQTEERSRNKPHYRNDQSGSGRDNKSRSSRQHDDEGTKEDRPSNRDNKKRMTTDDEHTSKIKTKGDYDSSRTGKHEHCSSKNYEDKLDRQTEDKKRNRKEDLSVTSNETRKNTDGYKSRQRNAQQSESDNDIREKRHKTNSDKHNKEKQNSKSDKKEKNREERNNHDRDQQREEYESRSSNRHKNHDRGDSHGRQSYERQDKKEKDGVDKDKTGDKIVKQKIPNKEKSDLDQKHRETSEKTKKEKRLKGEVKNKNLKKKTIDKKKSSNKKENRKRKRRPSTSSDSDSDSSDSSSSSDTSSSSSSDSDHKKKKKRRRYSSSSSSSSSTSSSSESSSTSSSSSDSDAKTKKNKKKRTMIKSKRK